MLRAGQAVPLEPCIPDDDTLVLRAKLILEEALETIHALGVSVQLKTFESKPYTLASTQDQKNDPKAQVPVISKDTELHFYRDANLTPDLTEIVDGCCDVRVVTTGTLSACGVPDYLVQLIVDDNNLSKFGPGGYRREDGKWMKPPNFVPCTNDLIHALRTMIYQSPAPTAERISKINRLNLSLDYGFVASKTSDPYTKSADAGERLEASKGGQYIHPTERPY